MVVDDTTPQYEKPTFANFETSAEYIYRSSCITATRRAREINIIPGENGRLLVTSSWMEENSGWRSF
jgi:hypothetical protein